MARRGVNLMGVCLLAMAAVACGRADGPDAPAVRPEGKAASSSDPAPGASVPLYKKADCPSLPQGSPSRGDVFDYRLLTDTGGVDASSLRRQVIGRVSGDTAEYDETLEVATKGPFPAEARGARFAILPTNILGATVRYEGAHDAISRLRPGQTISIPVTYSRGASTLHDEAEVTLLECGVSEAVIVGAANEPVIVYRLVMPYSTSLNPDELSEKLDNQFIVSHSRGWPIAERVSSGTLVLTSRKE